ncbi:MAG: hypothetical protein ABI120_19445 [Gemmatimonadaceae bacterium]
MLLASLFVLSACFGAQGKPDVQVTNGTTSGSAVVTNRGPDIALGRTVTVEKHVGSTWTATDAAVRLIAACEEVAATTERVLHRGETLSLKPWNGWTCGGQCGGSCRANVYLGPGEFRFVVVSANGKQRFEGPAFLLGAPPVSPGKPPDGK